MTQCQHVPTNQASLSYSKAKQSKQCIIIIIMIIVVAQHVCGALVNEMTLKI